MMHGKKFQSKLENKSYDLATQLSNFYFGERTCTYVLIVFYKIA